MMRHILRDLKWGIALVQNNLNKIFAVNRKILPTLPTNY